MKKLLCFALVAMSFTVNAQEIDATSIISNNQVLKTAYESETLSLKDKIEVVNQQVEEGNVSEKEAYKVIAKFSDQENVVEVVEESPVNYDYNWGKEENAFDYAMGVQLDTVVRYDSKITPYLAVGVGNVATNGAFANSEFGYLRSNYVEWGVAVRTPFSKTNNKWGIRYGLGFKYNGLATTQNRLFAMSGNGTVTRPAPLNLRKNYAYLRNTYITVPVSFDFSTSEKKYNEANRRFVTTEGYNFGVGGYLGYNINSKQHLRYDVGDDKIYEQQKGDWGVNDFQYGLMAYFGKDHAKIVIKYDLNPVFKNNAIDQNYWSIGLQLGL
ncbi:outer membrane beta-barrel protein [Flavobacterium sp. xlx-214]|uniref:outer membrane beta-barrel protein n=1 Tax=unclassified Flavobacterium TaxID=196869 RepID=UPI0013D6012E|nr:MULTISPECIES: outer membrane beta-barrel protein [unclassified Flavobacterium]MBA5793075.1 outer membrane beta-barrel protein [Flavobacterium sp. xlx-221]QMI82633.1 outer membrane beta-barrel protein [Flavobacterium sp. xlx-214]